MKVMITAGGTSEKIDQVRKITNMATGKLGALIAAQLTSIKSIEKIYYICEEGAITPMVDFGNIEVIHTQGVLDLERTMKDLLTTEKIDVVIHSMAISDYMVGSVMNSDQKELDRSSKISSNEESLIVTLVKTPKIISQIKQWSPTSHLVGFKLLDHVSREELIETAHKLLVRNGCDLVVANDLANVTKERHEAFLVYPDGSYYELDGKYHIARRIALYVGELR